MAITPGLDFDPVDGKKFVRLSYAGAPADMEVAITRLRDFLTRR